MYKGELPGLEWDEKSRRYFARSEYLNAPNATPSSSSGARVSSLQAGQVPTASPVINSLKHSKRGKLFTCGVCLDEKRERVQLPCTHLFCRPCLTTWLERKGHCPTCRQVVDVALHTAEMAARTTFNPLRSTGVGYFDAETLLRGRGDAPPPLSEHPYFAQDEAQQAVLGGSLLGTPIRPVSLVSADQCSGTTTSDSDDAARSAPLMSSSEDTGGPASSTSRRPRRREWKKQKKSAPSDRNSKRKSATSTAKAVAKSSCRKSASSSSTHDGPAKARRSRRGSPMKRRNG